MKINKLSHAIIAVIAGVSSSVAFAQNTASDSPEEIVVQGFRASLAKAADKKREADTIQDSIVAEDLGKMPDQNVAESLQRITGVSISRSNGEGSKVTIRGFGPQFNVVKMNDRTLATTGAARDFDFSILPSELISGADVIKSPTARLASGSIGGYVNLHSARPLDNPGFHASGSVNAKYQDLNAEVNPEISGVISDTFADDTIGVLLGVSYKNTDNRIDTFATGNWGEYSQYNKTNNEQGYGFPLDKSKVLDENGKATTLAGSRGPGRLRYQMSTENRERIGANATIQWAPSENFVSTFDALYSKLSLDALGSGVTVASQENYYTAASVNSRTGTLRTATQSNFDLEMLLSTNDEADTTKAFGYNFVYTQDKLTLSGDISYSKATADSVHDGSTAHRYTRWNADGTKKASSVTFDFTHGDIPYMTMTGLNVTDASSVRLHWQDLQGNKNSDEVKEAKFDAKYEIDTSIVKSLEAGVAYSNRELQIQQSSLGNRPGGNFGVMYFGEGSNDAASATWAIDSSIFTKTPDNYMGGAGGNFPHQWLGITNVEAYRNAVQKMLVAHASEDVWGSPRSAATNNPTGRWDYLYPAPSNISGEEITQSAYVQTNLGGDLSDYTWTGNVGGRFVKTENESIGLNTTIGQITSGGTNPVRQAAVQSTTVSSVNTDDQYFLPSGNFSLNLNDGNYIRLGAAKSITRPSLSDSSATFIQSADLASPTVSISGSNPYLKPYQVKSFDLSFEHYGEDGSAYSVGYFFKDITSFISTITTRETWKGAVAQDLKAAWAAVGSNEITAVTTGPGNRAGGTVQGLEVGALKTFDNLPGFWSGFGVQANYTYATSKDKDAASTIAHPSVVEPGNGLEGFAKNSYNLTAFYDKDGVEVRLAYNYRGDFMNSRSGDGLSAEYNAAYGQIDFSTSYEINDNLTASFEIANLTNEKRVQYLGQRDRVSYVEMSGARYQLGLRAKF